VVHRQALASSGALVMLIADHRKNACRNGSAQHCSLIANYDADSCKAAQHKRIEIGLFSALTQWS
jgi:hypothetical protein